LGEMVKDGDGFKILKRIEDAQAGRSFQI